MSNRRNSTGVGESDGSVTHGSAKPDNATTVRRDIVLLTTLLQGRRPGDSVTAFKSNINGAQDYILWSHVASVISAWGPYTSEYPNNSDSAVVAVTGRLEADRLVAAVVSATAICDDTAVLGRLCSLLAAEDVTKLRADEVEHLLDNLDDLRADVPLKTHLQDAISIVEWLSRVVPRSAIDRPDVPADQQRWKYTFLLFCFIVKRGYRRLFARLQIGKALWQGHPLSIIHDFYCQCTLPSTSDSASDASDDNPGSHSLSLSPSFQPPTLRTRPHLLRNLSKFLHLLERHNLYPDCTHGPGFTPDSQWDTGTYTVSSSSAAAWADLLRTCYTTLLASVSCAASEGDSERESEAWCPGTKAECEELCAAMVALREMLRAGIVNQLITEAVRKELERQYTEGPHGSSLSWSAAGDTLDATGCEGDSRARACTAAGGDYDPNYLQADGELPRRHVLRYLQSLVQPFSTAFEIVAHLYDNQKTRSPLRLDVYHVQVTSMSATLEASADRFDYDGFVDKLLGSMDIGSDDGPALADTRRSLELLKDTVLAWTAMRAEAALMSLAAGGWRSASVENDATKTYLHDVFAGGISRDNTPIILDSARRCCYCCALLGQLLQPCLDTQAEDSDGRPRRPLKFILEPDGTHGIIVPWLPPDDLPLDVLRDIRARLMGVLRRDIAARTARDVP